MKGCNQDSFQWRSSANLMIETAGKYIINFSKYSYEEIVGHKRNVVGRKRTALNNAELPKEKSNKMQQCTNILLLHIYIKHKMFRATHCPPSGA